MEKENRISFHELKTLVRYMKTFGFTDKGRRFWFDKNKDNLKNPESQIVRDMRLYARISSLSDFILEEAHKFTYTLPIPLKDLDEKLNEYISPEFQKMADRHTRDNLAWMTGTGRYSQG